MKPQTMTFWERNAPEILGLLVIALLVLFGFDYAHGQSLSPVVVECGRKCSGTFTVTNNGLSPAAVSVEAYSFKLDPATGNSLFRPLDSTVQLDLDETGARLGPKEEHEFGYRLHCAAYPCLVTIFAAITTGHTNNGVALRFFLPHVVYQCEKAKNCRRDARMAAGLK